MNPLTSRHHDKYDWNSRICIFTRTDTLDIKCYNHRGFHDKPRHELKLMWGLGIWPLLSFICTDVVGIHLYSPFKLIYNDKSHHIHSLDKIY